MCNGTINDHELVSDVKKLQIMNRLYICFEIYRFGHKMRSRDVVAIYDILRETFHYLVEEDAEENLFSYCVYLTVKEKAEKQNKTVREAIRGILAEFAERDADLREHFNRINGNDGEDDPEMEFFHRKGEELGALPEMFTEVNN